MLVVTYGPRRLARVAIQMVFKGERWGSIVLSGYNSGAAKEWLSMLMRLRGLSEWVGRSDCVAIESVVVDTVARLKASSRQ